MPPIRDQDTINSVAFCPDGVSIVSANRESMVRRWEIETGQPIGPPLQPRAAVNAVAVCPDGRTVLASNGDGTARLHDVLTRKPIGPPLASGGHMWMKSFSQDGQVLLCPGNISLRKVSLWRIPAPLSGTVEQLELWAQVATGMELDSDGIYHVLEVSTWRSRQRRLAYWSPPGMIPAGSAPPR
jgi:WD40 repeat protein